MGGAGLCIEWPVSNLMIPSGVYLFHERLYMRRNCKNKKGSKIIWGGRWLVCRAPSCCCHDGAYSFLPPPVPLRGRSPPSKKEKECAWRVYYSKKGIAAKKVAKIYPIKLPPRTPSLMPLDYSIWARIAKQLMDEAPQGTETKKQFLARLRRIATSLPKSYIKSVIAKMRPNLKALVEARGYTPKND